ERGRAMEGEVVAFGEVGTGPTLGVVGPNAAREVDGGETRRVDELPTGRRLTLRHEVYGVGASLDRADTGAPRELGPVRARIGDEGVHEPVAVEDAGGRRPQCAGGAERRFAASDAVGLPKFEIVDAMGRAAPREGFELGPLLGGRSDDELAEPAVRDAVARTELVEQG